MKKRILFLTGTRADFGKLKSLMQALEAHGGYEVTVFVTGMHMLRRYGFTVEEVRKSGLRNIHTFINQVVGEPMEMVLSHTTAGLSRFLAEDPHDLIVVHGDRVEALAGAIVGALRNTLVAHVEGGELSGTADELMRHAITKMSHLHFVANEAAATRLRQLGEDAESIFVIGSPDIDAMASERLPSIAESKGHYAIPFLDYNLLIFHPVTTELEALPQQAAAVVDAVLESGLNYVVVYPNNDPGSDTILDAYEKLKGNSRFRLFPSIRFEHFLTLMKHAKLLLGNSSAGIREAPYYGLPSVNIGSRQRNRFQHHSIINTGHDKHDIAQAIKQAIAAPRMTPSHHFGNGNSHNRFLAVLAASSTWQTSRQKIFHDLPDESGAA